MPYNRDRVKSSVTRKFGAVPGGATLGQTLWREKSQSTGNLLETSNDFDTREKWIEGNSKLDTKANVAQTASRVSKKNEPTAGSAESRKKQTIKAIS